MSSMASVLSRWVNLDLMMVLVDCESRISEKSHGNLVHLILKTTNVNLNRAKLVAGLYGLKC